MLRYLLEPRADRGLHRRLRACSACVMLAVACSEHGQVLGERVDRATTVVSAVSAGDDHACAILDGALFCWGSNGAGQLGDGTLDERDRARLVAVDRRFIAVSAGSAHTCAITASNEVFCWGDNRDGQLGSGDRVSRAEPHPVALPASATQIASDANHACALLSDASLWCWGQNDEGQLGQGDEPTSNAEAADALLPVEVPGAPYQSVDTGQGHTCAIRGDGTLWCWGRNSEHELGPATQIQNRSPLELGSDADWLGVRAGQSHTCAEKLDRSLWCWGQNSGSNSDEGYPLGIAGASSVTPNPTRVGTKSDWAALSTDTFHTCAIDASHVLYCWGRNQEGQLGLDDTDSRQTPARVSDRCSDIDVGRFFTCIVDGSGVLACAGENNHGQLGTGDRDRRAVFTPVLLSE